MFWRLSVSFCVLSIPVNRASVSGRVDVYYAPKNREIRPKSRVGRQNTS